MPKQSNILATAEATQNYDSTKHGKGTFKTVLGVKDHTDYDCCKLVEATFSIKPDVEGKRTRTKKDEWIEIGYAVAYIIDRTAVGDDKRKLWLKELVNADYNADDAPEIVRMMRTLYSKGGQIQSGVKPHADQLKADKILHIDTVKLELRYQGGGLGGIALGAMPSLLPQLDNDHAFSGLVVLSPATPEDLAVQFNKKGSAYEQETKLIEIYESQGYATWLRGAENEDGSMSVMGRQV